MTIKEFKIGYSVLIERLKTVTGYYSGKRAADAEGYFRHAATSADSGMLAEILEDACSKTDLALGRRGHGYTVRTDELTFRIAVADSFNSERERTVATILQNAVTAIAMESWLMLTGAPIRDDGSAPKEAPGAAGCLSLLIDEITAQERSQAAGTASRPAPPL